MSFQIQISGAGGSGKTAYIEQFAGLTDGNGKTTTTLVTDKDSLAELPNDIREMLINMETDRRELARLLGKNEVTFELLDNCPELMVNIEKTDGHVILLDTTDPKGIERMEEILQQKMLTNKPRPIVVCGNKTDSRDRVIMADMIVETMQKYPSVFYYDISAKSTFQIDKPLILIARILSDKENRYVQIFKIHYNSGKATDIESFIEKQPK